MVTPQEIIAKMENKKSQLCIGLDLRIPHIERLEKAIEIIEATGDLAIAYKPNRQFWLGFSLDEMKTLTTAIKKQNCYAIIDHKLSDIGSTNDAALEWASLEGFDLMTISPYPGNISASGESAKKFGLGLIYLLLMSNPEAEWMINSPIESWAREMETYSSGIVLGLSNFSEKKLLLRIKELLPTPFILAPGLGAQGGDHKLLEDIFGKRVMYTVSRGISQADNIREAAERYYNITSHYE